MTNSHNPGLKAPVYSPLWSTEHLSLPRDRATINAWCRSFYALNPEINRIINQHSVLPLKYFKLKECDNAATNNYYYDMLNSLLFPSLLENMLQEYFLIGELFIYASLNDYKGCWDNLIIQNPDYMIVKRTIVANELLISLRPDENLRRLVFSSKEEDIKIAQMLNSSIIENVKNRENIPLDNFNITHFSRKMSPCEIRGTSPLVSLFTILQKSELTEEDKLTIRECLMDIECLTNSLQKDILHQKYLLLFNMLENWFNKKLFAPIAKMNGFYKPQSTGEEKILNFPRVEFDTVQLIKDIKKVK